MGFTQSIGFGWRFLIFGLAGSLSGKTIEFDRDIRPILSDNCYHCHGPDAKKRKAKLRLDIKEGALADLGDYAAVVPGNPAKSELFNRISSDDPEERMPPHDSNRKLSNKEIALLKEWIASGANWKGHWTFEPVKRPVVEEKGRHPIDVLVDLQQLGGDIVGS